jgi:DNA-binding transcriptional MerR regulator
MSEEIPMPMIQSLKQQGMSNNDIIQTLQRQGYTSSQIFDALSRPIPQSAPPRVEAPQQRYEASTDTEELIETIIDEKWNDLLADINKVIAWKEATDAKLIRMEQQMTDLKDSFDKLQQAIVGKVGEYDQHILEVGAEVKAMEKVFSKVLPVFTDNVAELSRVTDQLKKNIPKK